MNYKFIKTENVANYRLFNLYKSTYENERNGNINDEIMTLDMDDTVSIIPIITINGQKHIVMVSQFRFGTKAHHIEIPGGIIDPGEDPYSAAVRELLEETGLQCNKMRSLGTAYCNPAYQDSLTNYFVAEDCVEVSSLNQDLGENITVKAYPEKDIRDCLRKGILINHSTTIVGLSRYFLSQ